MLGYGKLHCKCNYKTAKYHEYRFPSLFIGVMLQKYLNVNSKERIATYTVCDGLWPSYNHASNASVHANMGVHVVFTWPKPYFNVCALIFYACEGSSQAIKHAKKIMVSIFLTMKTLTHSVGK